MSESKKTKEDKQLNSYLKYSAMAFQLIAVIGLAVWGGLQIDRYLELSFPWFMVILSVLGFTGSLIAIIKSLPKE
jgi:ATP synthase protein I